MTKLFRVIAATLLCMAVLWWIDPHLIAAGGSIVALELCGAAWPCGTLLHQWDSHRALPWAWASLAFDVPFVVLYPWAISSVVLRLRAALPPAAQRGVAARVLTAAAWAAVAAGVLDARERR